MDQALKLAPDDAWQWGNKGLLLHNLGMYDTALEALNQAVSLDKKEPIFHLNRSVTLFALGRWEEGFAALRDALPLFGDTSDILTEATASLVQQILTSDINQWRARVESLTTMYVTHEQALALGQALVRSVPGLHSPLISPDARRLWVTTWQSQTTGRSEFALPLRLLDVAVRFINSGDPPDTRILLELQAEERSLLKPLLGIKEAEEDED